MLHWFNPLAWLAAFRFDECAELAADKMAIEDEPALAGDLAGALLLVAQDATRTRILAPAASGRTLSRRLTRLIEPTAQPGERMMLTKRIPLLLLLTALIGAGAVQVNLVAQDEPLEAIGGGAGEITVKAAQDFAAKVAGTDELHKQFKAALQTEAGALALRDRVGQMEAEAREEAYEDAIPELVNSIFVGEGDKLKLREDKQAFRSQYLSATEKVNQDLAAMRKTLNEVAGKMKLESDLDKIVHRFVTNESAPIILYVRELRPRLRPGMRVLEEILEGVFARRQDGKYAIRADARPAAEQRAKRFTEFQSILKRFRRDVRELGAEISQHDDFHKRVHAAFTDPLFTARLGAELIEDGGASRIRAERLIGNLEGALREGAEGLVVHPNEREEVGEFIEEFERGKAAAARLRAPLKQFAERIADDDELHKAWREMLQSDLALIQIGGQLEYATADAGDAIREFLSQIINEQPDGSLKVEPQEADEEELIEGISDIFRASRAARRRGRELEELLIKVDDTQLRDAMQSAAGKVVFGDYLNRHLASTIPNGLDQWIDDHFERTTAGFRIRGEAEEAIRDMLKDVDAIKEELENADF